MTKKINLTREQQTCVDFPDDKNLLIRGIAGSGKSLIILKKAAKIAKKSISEGDNKKIAIFTYINTLVNYTHEILSENSIIAEKINVSTLDLELVSLYKRVTGKQVSPNQMSSYKYNIKKCSEILDKIVKAESCDNRFLKDDKRDFLYDEIVWIKQRMYKNEADYLKCDRVGRGVSVKPTREDRKIIFKIYKSYYRSLEASNIYDYDAMYEELYDNKDKIPESCKYTHLLIDESQDLSLNKLMLARAICTEAMVFAADYAQKIYKTGFSWKELGIDIKGNASKKLKGTFRNTYEILALANSLIPHNNIIRQNKDEYVEPEMPTIHGNKPRLYTASSLTEERDMAIEIAQKVAREHPDDTVAIITNLNKDIDWIADALEVKGIPYERIAKGQTFKVLEPGIKLVNFYSSKGLEFDNVVLTLLDEKKFPYIYWKTSADQLPDILDQARNLFYVGITRAKTNLFMTNCGKSRSRLLNDLDTDLYDKV